MILCKEILQPGMRGETAQNIHASNQLAIAAGALLALSIALAVGQYLANRKLSASALSFVCAIITAFHPVWTVSTRSGDCGMMRHFFSWIVAGILGLFVILQMLLLIARRDDANMRADYDDRPILPSA